MISKRNELAEFDMATTNGIMNLRELDSLAVTCIVDNECDTMSSGVDTIDGFQYNSERKKHTGAENMCVAGHGLSLLLTATCNECNCQEHNLLMDAGPTPDLWIQNAKKLDVDYGSIEVTVLSHYHYDHSGGLRGAVPAIAGARHSAQTSGAPLIVDLQSSNIVSRGRKSNDGKVTPHSPTNPSAEELSQMGARVKIHDDPHTILERCFYVSGYVPRGTNSYETGMSPTHVTLNKNDEWISDTDISDERYVVCNIRNRGLVIVSACSHAGINNVCQDAMSKSNHLPIFGILGGLHLADGDNIKRVGMTVADLKQNIKPSIVIGGHCTGWRGKAELARVFPGHFQPLAVGGTYTFHA